MLIFVTGATGFVGSVVIDELLGAGHEVLGLARSEEKAAALKAKGASILYADLTDLESLRCAAESADAVIHTGFVHDFSRYAECCEIDRIAINAIGRGLKDTNRPLIITSTIPMQVQGRIVTEADPAPSLTDGYPRKSEAAAGELQDSGINAAVVRLPPSVHGQGDHGFVPTLIDIARKKGVSAYFATRDNHWPAVHRRDAARLFHLAVEHGKTDGPYQAVAEEAVPFKKIAEAIGELLGVPTAALNEEEAKEHFDWFHMFASMDCAASSKHTRSLLGWHPREPELLIDIAKAGYGDGSGGLSK